MNHTVFENGQLVAIEGPGPMEFEWDDHDTALQAAGYNKLYEAGPSSSGISIYKREQLEEVPASWRDLEFYIEYWIGEDAIEDVYAKNVHAMWEFLRYVAPVFQMLWIDDVRLEAEERARQAHPEKYRRERLSPEQIAANKIRQEKTVNSWREHLAKAYEASGVAR